MSISRKILLLSCDIVLIKYSYFCSYNFELLTQMEQNIVWIYNHLVCSFENYSQYTWLLFNKKIWRVELSLALNQVGDSVKILMSERLGMHDCLSVHFVRIPVYAYWVVVFVHMIIGSLHFRSMTLDAWLLLSFCV